MATKHDEAGGQHDDEQRRVSRHARAVEHGRLAERRTGGQHPRRQQQHAVDLDGGAARSSSPTFRRFLSAIKLEINERNGHRFTKEEETTDPRSYPKSSPIGGAKDPTSLVPFLIESQIKPLSLTKKETSRPKAGDAAPTKLVIEPTPQSRFPVINPQLYPNHPVSYTFLEAGPIFSTPRTKKPLTESVGRADLESRGPPISPPRNLCSPTFQLADDQRNDSGKKVKSASTSRSFVGGKRAAGLSVNRRILGSVAGVRNKNERTPVKERYRRWIAGKDRPARRFEASPVAGRYPVGIRPVSKRPASLKKWTNFQ
ncbi:hypothetical protein WN51_12127 [Melipona quadrifasciata]|uniref:Uncharacterized protein n=1 Tax=Melipona quadrifasciata TaxID=166423 RepID=A0A0M9A4R9_9HYME|nr:hypothetical protein WN51_12127 [Melipona quadrifasciata]